MTPSAWNWSTARQMEGLAAQNPESSLDDCGVSWIWSKWSKERRVWLKWRPKMEMTKVLLERAALTASLSALRVGASLTHSTEGKNRTSSGGSIDCTVPAQWPSAPTCQWSPWQKRSRTNLPCLTPGQAPSKPGVFDPHRIRRSNHLARFGPA